MRRPTVVGWRAFVGAVAAPSAACFVVLAFAAALALLAAPARSATINGRVVKGGERAPVRGVPVSVHVVRGNEELPGGSMPTDESGAFRFTGLADGQGLEYYVSAEYEGAFYTEGPIPVQSGQASTEMVVFDVGKSFEAVRVQDHHVIVERKEDGLHVTEIVIFQNDANTAYLGVGVNHASPSGMRVGLPASIKEFKPGLGLDEPSVSVQGRELTSRRPIPPGQRPLSFTYVVPLSGRMDLSHRLYFPTRQMTVLLDDPKLHVESTQLQSGGTREQGGKTYAMYIGSNLPVGAEVAIRVQGAGFFSSPKVYPFLVAPFAIGAVLWYAARRGSRQAKAKHAVAGAPGAAPIGMAADPRAAMAAPSSAGRPAAAPAPSSAGGPAPARPRAATASGNGDDEMAGAYLYLIAALDQGVERGEITPESHALVRANLKRRLEVILADAAHAKAR